MFSSSIGTSKGSSVNNPSLLYDAIFNSEILDQDVPSIPALDKATGECLDAYAAESVKIALRSGVKIRRCMHICTEELEAFLSKTNSQEYHDDFVKKMIGCDSQSGKEILTCNVDTVSSLF